MNKTFYLTRASIIAALYVVLTLIANSLGLANHAIQIRFSEALTILPIFTPAAVPGLFIGCMLSNILTGCMPPDILFGSIATLLGALGTRTFRKRKGLGILCPVLANTLIIPFVLAFVYHFEGSLWYFAFTVCAGEIISCGILGTLLMRLLKPYAKYLF